MVDEGKVGRVPDELVNQVVCGQCPAAIDRSAINEKENEMKLFKCPKCGNFSREASSTISLQVRILLHRDRTWSATAEASGEPCHEIIKKLDLSNTLCFECRKGPLELIEAEQCPHKINENYWNYYGVTRRCRLCGEEQMAKTIVFE